MPRRCLGDLTYLWHHNSMVRNMLYMTINVCSISFKKSQSADISISVNGTRLPLVKFHMVYETRATFETSNYPRRPCDRYTAPNSKCIGAEPPPPPNKKKKKKKNEKLLILVIGLVEKIGRTVKQSSDLKTSSIPVPLQSLEAQLSTCQVFHLWLFCWYCSFAMCIPVRTNIHGSVAFPVLLPIDKENPHHYWNVVYR